MNWERVAFRDLGQWFGGATPSKGNPAFWTDGSIPWLSPKDMGPMVLAETQDHITPDAVAGSNVKVVRANSVAVVVRSGILVRTLPVALVPFDTTLNQDMKAVVPRPGIDPRWVAWGLRAFERELLRTTRKAGTTVASIEMPRFNQYKLPVPDLVEQQRIVEVLEDHLTRLDVAHDSLVRARQRSESMVASARLRMLENAMGGAVSKLGDLAAVGTGTTPSRSRADYHEDGSVPWVTSGDLAQGYIEEPVQFVTERALTETSLKFYPVGTLLVAMYGEGKTRGTVAELGIPATTNQACAAVQVHDEKLRPWVRAVLDANYNAMRRLAAGGVQPNLNLGMIRQIDIPIPEEEDRARLLLELRAVLDSADALAIDVDRAMVRVSALRRSLLVAAFEGKLAGRNADAEVIEELTHV